MIRAFAAPHPRVLRIHVLRVVRQATAKTSRSLLQVHRHAATAGRLAAAAAVLHDVPEAAEALRLAARRVLSSTAFGIEQPAPRALQADDVDRAALVGLLAHADVRRVSAVTVAPDDGTGRWARIVFDRSTHVESVSDTFLTDDERLTTGQVATLHRLGLHPPDADHVQWWAVLPDVPLDELASLLLDLTTGVHGASAGDPVSFAVGIPHGHPDVVDDDDPSILDVERPNVPMAAAALADRLRLGIEAVGIDDVWLRVHQSPVGWYAHLGSNFDGNLYVEVCGDPGPRTEDRLDEVQKEQLRALGWSDPTEASTHGDPDGGSFTRLWQAPFDVDLACWHLMVTLAAVYGLDPDDPIHASASLFT